MARLKRKLTETAKMIWHGPKYYEKVMKPKKTKLKRKVRDKLAPTVKTKKHIKVLQEMGYSEKEARRIIFGE